MVWKGRQEEERWVGCKTPEHFIKVLYHVTEHTDNWRRQGSAKWHWELSKMPAVFTVQKSHWCLQQSGAEALKLLFLFSQLPVYQGKLRKEQAKPSLNKIIIWALGLGRIRITMSCCLPTLFFYFSKERKHMCVWREWGRAVAEGAIQCLFGSAPTEYQQWASPHA